MVGLNSDASVKRLKGAERPIQPEAARSIVLAGLAFVDAVMLFAEDTPLELLGVIKPDVLVKGADYSIDQVVGRDLVESYGGKVVLGGVGAGHQHDPHRQAAEDRDGERGSGSGRGELVDRFHETDQ